MRNLNRYERDFLIWMAAIAATCILVILTTSCAGLVKPETINQKLAYSEASLTATYNTIRDLKVAGRISEQKRNELVTQADTAAAAVDAARTALGAGDTSTALGKLQVARSVLVGLEAILKNYR